MLFTSQQRYILHWCGMMCVRRQSGEYSVVNMVLAYHYAHDARKASPIPSPEIILNLGKMVEPDQNKSGFRHRSVDPVPYLGWERSIALYCGAWEKMTPEQRYREFEILHPFQDGNGRVGVILFNWHRLDEMPRVPPDMFRYGG